MNETIYSIFNEFSNAFRLVDALDILLVSVFLYAALLWLRQIASRSVMIGVFALGLLYFIARGADMYLTSLAFHTTFAVLLFVLIVVFQEDLRRLFAQLSAFQPIGSKSAAGSDAVINDIVEVAFDLAASKTGGLIVLQGREPLERHLHGGIPLHGQVSKPLLYSIFDSSSPGHDGAVIIQNYQVEQFATHVPSSTNTREIAGRGTRHSAAIGLSECSDALVVVVSEERGVVSLAESGKLKAIASPNELKRRLLNSAAIAGESKPILGWKQHLFQHGRLKVMAVGIALISWVVLAYDPHTVQRTFIVPIEYRNLSSALVLDERAPDEARITLSGSERNFRFLEPSSLKVSIDLSGAAEGFQQVSITDRSIRLPLNLAPYRIEPRIIFLNLARRTNEVRMNR